MHPTLVHMNTAYPAELQKVLATYAHLLIYLDPGFRSCFAESFELLPPLGLRDRHRPPLWIEDTCSLPSECIIADPAPILLPTSVEPCSRIPAAQTPQQPADPH